jgi:N-acetylneuraminate synthase
MTDRVRFVAEVSSNHGRDLSRCLRFIDVAADVGCAGVKFQQFRIDRLFAPEALRRDPQLLARRAWELPEELHPELAARAKGRGLGYSCTPFYLDAVAVLEPHVDWFKISSYQVLWTALLTEVARTGKPLVLSTGMATLEEVMRAIDTLWDGGCRDLTLLHCVSTYPTRSEDSNLAAIETLRSAFGTPTGWSDHTVDPGVVLRAVHRWGATMVELHLDLEGDGDEYGIGHCWLPAAVAPLIDKALRPRREAELSPLDGSGRVRPRPRELSERAWRTDPSDGLRPLRETRGEWGEPLGAGAAAEGHGAGG